MTAIDQTTLDHVRSRTSALLDAVHSVYVGPRSTTEMLLVALLARGHILLEGVPGVAKTTVCKAFAATLACGFSRIQFTPDMMPADITGTYILAPREGTFHLRTGPIFANVVLGDEINRAPAKTQSALLEAMQERQVTIEGQTLELPNPFIVLATQNPVEQAGTYPLPEAQIDRFLVRLVMRYPSAADERQMLRQHSHTATMPAAILKPDEVLWMQSLLESVFVDDELLDYVIRIAAFTREHARLVLGVSPRAALALVQAARARALLSGRSFVTPDDIRALVGPVLAHRLVLTPDAELEGAMREGVLAEALERVPHHRGLART